MEVLCNLEFCCKGSAFHCPIMNYTIMKDPWAVRDRQQVGNNTCSPRRGSAARGSTGQMVVLESRPFYDDLPKKEVNPSNMVLCLGCGLCGRAGKGGEEGGLFHLEALKEAELKIGHGIDRRQPLLQEEYFGAVLKTHTGVRADQHMLGHLWIMSAARA